MYFAIGKLHHSWMLGFLAVAVCPMVMGQVVGGTLSGTVTDPSGAVIASAEVSATNVDTRIVRTTATKSDGVYAVSNLKPGKYDVSVTATGFRKLILPNILLTVGSEQQLNVKMSIGETSQDVQVVDMQPAVQLVSSANFMAVLMSFCATAHWMPRIISI